MALPKFEHQYGFSNQANVFLFTYVVISDKSFFFEENFTGHTVKMYVLLFTGWRPRGCSYVQLNWVRNVFANVLQCWLRCKGDYRRIKQSVSQPARKHFEMIRWTTRATLLQETPASVLENYTMVNIPAVASTGNLLETGVCDRIPDDGFIAGTKKISGQARLLNQV